MCLADWTYEQLMYIDETAANERTLDRKYGWAPVGQPARQIESFHRSTKWSILPLYTVDGFIDWEIIHGSYNADLFVLFLEEHVIPHTNPYPGPRSVLIMDNAKIHHDEVHARISWTLLIVACSGYLQCCSNQAGIYTAILPRP